MAGMKQSDPKSVDEYIASQPEAVRPKLEQVRAAIRRAVPEAVEGIGYRMPGYRTNRVTHTHNHRLFLSDYIGVPSEAGGHEA